MKKNQKGFTLVELIIVIAILGILAGLAIPSFIGFTANARKQADKEFADNVASAALMIYADTGSVATGDPKTVAAYAPYIDEGYVYEHYTGVTVSTTDPTNCDNGAFEILAVTLTDGSETYVTCK